MAIGRWMNLKEAAAYMSCSITTVQRHIEQGFLDWHVTGTGFRRLDREQIDALFTIPNRGLVKNRGVVTAEDERRFIIPKELRQKARNMGLKNAKKSDSGRGKRVPVQNSGVPDKKSRESAAELPVQ